MFERKQKDTRSVFIVGKQYSRKDIYGLLHVPTEKRRGNWETGYTKYQGEYYVFVNVEIPGRTGHNYNDKWLPEGTLLWHGKNNTKLNQPGITEMISNSTPCHFFTRNINTNAYFTYQGCGKAVNYFDRTPVEVIWEFPEGNASDSGGSNDITAQKYTPRITMALRNMCLSHYGTECYVCGEDFGVKYGSLGEGYIRVSFYKPDIREKGEPIDPISDLRPICPNCLSMMQRRPAAPISMEELKAIIS